MSKLTMAILTTVMLLGIGSAAIYAQERDPSAGRSGMGPWMMGDYGGGPGREMMGGYGMGPGMMWGRGRAYGMGPGMMGGVALGSLDLSDAQRKQVLSIQDQLRKSNWDLMGKMQDEMAKQRDAYAEADRPDRAVISAANKRMFDLRQQMLDNEFDAAEKIEKILTPQQREQWKKQRRSGWMMGFGE